MDIKIKFNRKSNKALAYDEDKVIGYCEFEEKNGTWIITHTIVSRDYSGNGIAKRLLDCVVDAARDENIKIYPVCSYAVRKFEQSKDYRDVDARVSK